MGKNGGQFVPTGKEHPSPDTIPHVSQPTTQSTVGLTGTSPTNLSTSPMKESGLAKEADLVDPNEGLVGISNETYAPNEPRVTGNEALVSASTVA